MHLIKLSLHNFMPYENTEVTFPSTKVVNICGYDFDRNTSNGAGKSSIIEAIIYVLWGKSRVSLGDLVRRGATDMKVKLVFSCHNRVYRIERGISSGHSTLKIYLDNNVIDIKGIKENQKYIENLLKCNYEQFINFSVIDTLRFEDLDSLGSTEIKKLLSNLFNQEKCEKVLSDLKIENRSLSLLLNQLTQNKIKHFYSNKRRLALETGLLSIESLQKSIGQKIQEIEVKLSTLISDESKYKTLIRKYRDNMKYLINRSECPICFTPLDKKTDILNKYQNMIQLYEKTNLVNISKQKTEILNKRNELYHSKDKIVNRIYKIKDLLKQLNKSKYDTTNINETQKQYELNALLIYTISRLISYILQRYLKRLEIIINSFLLKLTDIQCKLSFVKDDKLLSTLTLHKNFIALFRNGTPFSYSSLSSGEKMLVTYAFKMAINSLTLKESVLFIDEGFNKLHINSQQKLRELLQVSPFNQIFTTSLSDKIDKEPYIFVKKFDNKSEIVVYNI